MPPAPLPGGSRPARGAGAALVLGAGALACAALTWWLVGASTLVGVDYFSSFSVPYLRNFGNDQRTAGFVAWFAGGLPLLAALAEGLLHGGGTAGTTDTEASEADNSESLVEHS